MPILPATEDTKRKIVQEAEHPPILIEQPKSEAERQKPTLEDVRKAVKKISDTQYELAGMTMDLKAGQVRLPAKVKVTKGLLEYVIVSEGGAMHEALFVTPTSPFELQVALLLMGFKTSETFFTPVAPGEWPVAGKNPVLAPESLFELLVEFKKESEAPLILPVGDWVKNLKTGEKLAGKHWVFNGSFFTKEGDLAAGASGNLVSLYLDPVAIANNPRQGNDDDENWQPMPDVPAEDTGVTLIFQKITQPTSLEKSKSK